MIPRQSRGSWLRAGFAVLIAGSAALAAALPAHADYVDNDLKVAMPTHTITAGSAGKPVAVQLIKTGSDAAHNVVVTIDASKVDSDAVGVEFAKHDGCTVAKLIETCRFDELTEDDRTTSFGLVLTPTAKATAGNAGTVVATVTSDTKDETAANDSGSYPITVADPGVDLVALASPVAKPIKPGHTRPVAVGVANAGSTAVHGVSFTLDSGSPEVTFADRYQECTTKGRTISCTLPELTLAPDTWVSFVDDDGAGIFHLAAGTDAYGPTRHAGTFTAMPVKAQTRAARRGGRSLTARLASATPRKAPKSVTENDPSDNSTSFAYRIADNPADLAISAPAVDAKQGQTVTVRATVTNGGPGSSNGFWLEIRLPRGTSLVGLPTVSVHGRTDNPCRVLDDGHPECGWYSEFTPGTKGKLVLRLKVTAAHPGTGKIILSSSTTDRHTGNNTATISLSGEEHGGGGGHASPSTTPVAQGGHGGGSGSLPVTGGKLGLIGAAGAVLLLAGGTALMLARRRRAAGRPTA